MRFHIGFSKRISKKTIIFILGLLSMALAMFFGNTEIVFAESTITQSPGYMAYYRDNADNVLVPTKTCNDYDCYITITNMGGFNGYNFTASYDFGSLSCPSGYADISIHPYLFKSGFTAIDTNINLSNIGGNGSVELVSYSNGQAVYKFKNVKLSNPVTFRVNASNGNSTAVNYFLISRSIVYDCITDTNLVISESANSIIDNQNQNTQDIIDNQNDSNTSTSQSSANSFFNNFSFNDTRGLTSVITSPIRLLQGIINSTDSCSNYTFSISMLGTQTQQVSLPSGCILWNNVPQPVILAYWIIVWAIVGYRALIDMIHFASSLRDPDKKNDYTLDL